MTSCPNTLIHRHALTSTLLLLHAMFAVTCTEEQAVDAPAQTSEQAPASQDMVEEAAASQPASVHQQLDALDARTPVPLQPMMAWHQKQNMQQHLVAIAQITDALAREDWEAVERAAGTIGTSPSMRQMCEHMGAGAPGFTELAMTFHERADSIGAAAKERDLTGTLSATARTLQVCTSCHATYKQHIVDADTWQTLTDSAHTPPHPP